MCRDYELILVLGQIDVHLAVGHENTAHLILRVLTIDDDAEPLEDCPSGPARIRGHLGHSVPPGMIENRRDQSTRHPALTSVRVDEQRVEKAAVAKVREPVDAALQLGHDRPCSLAALIP